MARKAPGKAHRKGLTVVELMDMFPTEVELPRFVDGYGFGRAGGSMLRS